MVTQTALPLPSVAVRGDVQKTFIDVKVLSGFTDSGHIEILLGDYLSRLNDTDKALALSEIDAIRAFVANLLVIGHYRMGFELLPQRNGSMLRVFIEYALPERVPARWLGRLFGLYYARWCTQQMVNDAVKHFAPST